MKCPKCAYDLGDGLMPARCPKCGCVLSRAHQTSYKNQTQAANDAIRIRQGVDSVQNQDTKQNKSRNKIALGVIAIVAVLAIAGIFFWQKLIVGAHVVPDVLGKTQEQAIHMLEEKGLRAVCITKKDDGPAGVVLKQTPGAYSYTKDGDTITLTISEQRHMPNLKGMTKAQAVEALTQQDIKYTFVQRFANEEDGTAVDQSVAADQVITQDQTVEVALSQRPRVPDILGLTQDEAVQKLQEQTLGAKFSYVPLAQGQKDMTVASFAPQKDTPMNVQSSIDVQIASQRAGDLQQKAEEILRLIYDVNPAPQGLNDITAGPFPIGASLRNIIDPNTPITRYGDNASIALSDATDFEIWCSVVKHWNGYPNPFDNKDLLERHIVKINSLTCPDLSTVVIDVDINWIWKQYGAGYENITTQDRRTITLKFSEDMHLVSIEDSSGDDAPQADPPTPQIPEQNVETNTTTNDPNIQDPAQVPQPLNINEATSSVTIG